MDPNSPFSHLKKPEVSKTGRIYVNYCDNCHYTWKAPAPATGCVNCKLFDPEDIRVLVDYNPGIPIV
jgi:hypothetical protein